MMKIRVLDTALLAGCLLAVAGAQASNLSFLGRGPIAKFNEADLDLLRGALGRALASDRMDAAQVWRNPATGASGEITPLHAFEHSGRPCRELRVVNRHPGVSSDGRYTLCRDAGRWRLSRD